MDTYDSAPDTIKHIETVRGLIVDAVSNFTTRAVVHDKSKLEEPEKGMYDHFTPKLRGLTYGSLEYKLCLAQMGPALAHHYASNSHHPEHYKMWQCPICEAVFPEEDAPIDTRFEGEIRLCPICCKDGTIMECTLIPASGIYGMSLFDVLEMLIDWKAAGMRHADGDIQKSLEINRKRFGMSDQLFAVFQNTVKEMNW